MTLPEPQGNDRFGAARGLLSRGVDDKAYSAAVLLAARGDEIALHAAAGEAALSSVFDVASLTKPLVAALFFTLAQGGKEQPEDRLADVILPGPADPRAAGITFFHLLTHTSGLPAWKPYYEDLVATEKETGSVLRGNAAGHDAIVDAARKEALLSSPGTACVYSDIGYILLGRAIELAAFAPLDRLLRREISEPLRMVDTGYRPLHALPECETGRIVSTGYSAARGREKVGEVDDENAAAMGGVAGHAGIFSTAFDLLLFAREFRRALRGEGRVLARASAERMARRAESPPGCPRTPGWDTPSPSGSQAGRHFSQASVGHLGFTGCSLWIDIARGVTIVLLTNRIRYGQQNGGLKSLRPAIHDAVMEELGRG